MNASSTDSSSDVSTFVSAPSLVPTALSQVQTKLERGEEITADDLKLLRQEDQSDDGNPLSSARTSSIPYLDRKLVQNATVGVNGKVMIVRYVGMVQDILDLEFYERKTQDGLSTKYREHLLSSNKDDVNMDQGMLTSYNNISERQPVFVVPLPFASPWISSSIQEKKSPSEISNTNKSSSCQVGAGGEKRSYADTQWDTPTPSLEQNDGIESFTSSPSKKKLVTDFTSNISSASNFKKANHCNWCQAGAMNSDPNQTPILATFYPKGDESDTDDMGDTHGSHNARLNDVVQIVGVLSLDPTEAKFASSSSTQKDDANGGGDTEDYRNPFESNFHHNIIPPPSQLPRLHVLYHQPLDLDQISLYHSSLLNSDSSYTHDDMTSIQRELNKNFDTGDDDDDDRSITIKCFSKYLFQGNTIVAEGFLMSLLSAVERIPQTQQQLKIKGSPFSFHANRNRLIPKKIPSGSSVGSLSFNLIISSSSSEKALTQLQERLQRVLSEISPIVSTLNLSLSSLNDPKQISIPNKAVTNDDVFMNDVNEEPYTLEASEENCLTPSVIQLPRGSTIFIKEDQMTEGKLNSNGYNCMKALASIATKQECHYRFGISDFPFEADYCVFSISSQGRKSLVPCSTQICLSLSEDEEDEKDAIPKFLMQKIRAYIARCRAPLSASISQEICQIAEKEFVGKRSKQRKQGKTEDSLYGEVEFHRWLNLTRTQARSRFGVENKKVSTDKTKFLELSVEVDDWLKALALDDAMVASIV